MPKAEAITTEINPAGDGEDLLIAAGDAGGATSSGGQLELRGGLDTGAPGKPGSVAITADSTAGSGGSGKISLLGGKIVGVADGAANHSGAPLDRRGDATTLLPSGPTRLA